MSPVRYDDRSSQEVRFDALVAQLAQISGQLVVLLEGVRAVREWVDDQREAPKIPPEEKKHGAALALLLSPSMVLVLVALAIISASVAIVALVLTGNGAAVGDLAKGLKG